MPETNTSKILARGDREDWTSRLSPDINARRKKGGAVDGYDPVQALWKH